ncbi:type II secretion system F family protein [Candidatus Woesearchaeota archaeon]|nr:type II secretion system F family protein [Candidatus Woesearchaeota archaeon]
MVFELKTKNYISIGVGFLIILLDFIFLFSFSSPIGPKTWVFNPLIVIAVLVSGSSFLIDFFAENKRQKEIELKFLEFVRNLVENVRSGVSIPRAIQQVATVDYGALNPYIVKLAHQLEWGYPLHDALNIFADDTKNMVIKRSVAIVIQAEKSGGDMAAVLEAVSQSVWEIKKVKEEQKSQAYGQVIQGYIIFFVFIVIMLVLQIYLIPKLTDISGDLAQGLGGMTTMAPNTSSATDLKGIFIGAIFVQGLFAGLMIGKFSEGKFKNGVKHSLIMAIIGYLLMATITGIFAPEEVTTKAALLFLIPYKLLKGKN